MSKKISEEELNNVAGGTPFKDGGYRKECPLCHKNFQYNKSDCRKVEEGCTTYYYATCPHCKGEFLADED